MDPLWEEGTPILTEDELVDAVLKRLTPAVPLNRNEREEWGEIVPHLSTLRAVGRLPTQNAAVRAIRDWLKAKKQPAMPRSTIYDGIARYCAGWFRKQPKRSREKRAKR